MRRPTRWEMEILGACCYMWQMKTGHAYWTMYTGSDIGVYRTSRKTGQNRKMGSFDSVEAAKKYMLQHC